MKFDSTRVLPLPLIALCGVWGGCGTSYDTAAVDRRTADLYGTTRPWYETAAPALPDLPEHAELSDYLRFGLENNAGLRAAFHRWHAELESVPQVTQLPDPVFTWGYFVEPIETRTGPQRNRFSLQQTFPWFGKLDLRGEVASQQAEAAWWKVMTLRREVVREIKTGYYEYGYLAQAIRITADNLRLLQQLEPIVQRRVQTGGNQEDLLRLQVEIGRVENDLQTLRKFRPALSARLGAAMNRKQTTVLPMPEAVELQVMDVEVELLAEQLWAANPELAALREEITRAQKRAELADLEGWPDVTLGADYWQTGGAMNPNTPGSGDDPWALRVTMNLPFFRTKYRAAVRQAERSEAAARGQLQDRQSRLRSDLEHAAYRLDDAGRQIALYRDTLLPRAWESFAVTQQSYRSDKATVLDVIDAERTLLAFEKSYWRAVSDYAQSVADLEAICGGDLK